MCPVLPQRIKTSWGEKKETSRAIKNWGLNTPNRKANGTPLPLEGKRGREGSQKFRGGLEKRSPSRVKGKKKTKSGGRETVIIRDGTKKNGVSQARRAGKNQKRSGRGAKGHPSKKPRT